MPESKDAETKVEMLKQEYIKKLNDSVVVKLQDGSRTFDEKPTTAATLAKQRELEEMSIAFQQFQDKAMRAIELKRKELIKPITDKVRAAISVVAKRKDYGYIINISKKQVSVLPDNGDLLKAVKKELRLK